MTISPERPPRGPSNVSSVHEVSRVQGLNVHARLVLMARTRPVWGFRAPSTRRTTPGDVRVHAAVPVVLRVVLQFAQSSCTNAKLRCDPADPPQDVVPENAFVGGTLQNDGLMGDALILYIS